MQDDHWQWRKDFLTCRLLANWRHGWFGRAVYPTSPATLHYHLSDQGSAKIIKQVHGKTIVPVQAIQEELILADGIYSNDPHYSIWVCSADCVPILIGAKGGAVMAIHAGWRGTGGGILQMAVDIFTSMGVSPSDLYIGLGPAISGDVYQVGGEVVEQVLKIIGRSVGVKADPHHPDRYLLDLRLVQQAFFQEKGVPPEHIAIAPYCTYQHSDLFFSYRRQDYQKVQWTGICANPLSSP